MALANFLGKTALSASQVLKQFDFENFQKLLLSNHIRISFNKASIASREGFAIVDMLVRLFARLYPNLHLHCADGKSPERELLNELALSINPFIDLSDTEATIVVVVGDTNSESVCTKIYIGSDQWISKFSRSKPQACGDSLNRFGAGAAACFAAANVFRYVFRAQLAEGVLDDDFRYSSFYGSINEEAEQGPAIGSVDFDDTVLVGLGAIGNGVIWAFRNLSIEGALHLIDGESIDISNLQRYILTTQHDVTSSKTGVAIKFLNQQSVQAYPFHFDEYLQKRGNWNISRAAVCVDSAHHRRMVQGSLPKKLINAWTQQEQCGLSRHYDFINEPCICCLYPASKEAKSLPLKIAESLGLNHPFHLQMVRDYMAQQKPVDPTLVHMVAQVKKIEPAILMPYIGERLEIFYAKIVCGGVMMTLTGGEQKEAADVPSAFESAMAGIMLAAELVIDSAQLRRHKPFTIQKLNLIRPVSRYTYDVVKKPGNALCICQDEIFRCRYFEKWKINPMRLPHLGESAKHHLPDKVSEVKHQKMENVELKSELGGTN